MSEVFSTAEPTPSGTVEVDGIAHPVWFHLDIAYEHVEEYERVLPRLQASGKLSPELVADMATFVSIVAPTLTREALTRMRPRRLHALFSPVLRLAFTDPFAVGRPSNSPAPTAPSLPESTTTPSEGA